MKNTIYIWICLVACPWAAPAGRAQSYVPEKTNSLVRVPPAAHLQAYAFSVKDVRLLESPFKRAMEKDGAYLLAIDPKRLLNRFYEYAGLPTKGPVYGGWESEGLSGHTTGHYLSACSLMYAATGDRQFYDRVDYLIRQLAACQDAKRNGYIGAIPGQDSIFGRLARGEIKTSGFDLNGGWSPWYTVHKLMAGLLDAYLYCDERKALDIAVKMADWVSRVLQNLDEAQLQKMLACEFGGMNEVLVNMYAITTEKKYLDLSYKFQHRAILEPLVQGKDQLAGKHSNTQIPKIIGCARRYELLADDEDEKIAEHFWDIMVLHHSYVIGGNSDHEYLTEPDRLSDFLSQSTCETCNTYNMLKLTRHLFCWHPDSRLADYYERALYNHILASQNPVNGMMCYFVPLQMGATKEFSDSFNTFTCCVGSGMESHSKYGESIYYEGSDGSLFVNLFIPSVLNWKAKNVVVRQQTRFPDSDTTDLVILSKAPATFILRIRKPIWAKNGLVITVNDKPVNTSRIEAGYILLSRTWHPHDRVRVIMPMSLYTESMPDNPDRIAFLAGPVVLAGDLGAQKLTDFHDVPVLLTNDHEVNYWVRPVAGLPLTFQTEHTGKPFDVVLTPFYQNNADHYSVYWDFFTDSGWARREEAYLAEKKRQADIQERTIDLLRTGEMQPERDHHLTSQNSYVDEEQGRKSRIAHSPGFFSFELKVDSTTENVLLVTYWGGENNRAHDIYLNGTLIATQELKHEHPSSFFDVAYPVPAFLVKDKTYVLVKFQAREGRAGGDVYGCRMLRK